MKDLRSNIGSPSTRRRVATIIAVVGVVFVASRLNSLWPRDVDVTYEVGAEVTELDVDYLQDREAVASVRFDRSAGEKGSFLRHTVRLQPGEYQIHITLYGGDGSAIEEARSLAVPAPGAARFDLTSASWPSE